MKYSKRVEIFRRLKTDYAGYLTSTLWKLTGNTEIFTEAFQYALLQIWLNLEKLTGPQAGAYIYRIALSANSKAWRNRIGRDGQISQRQVNIENTAVEKADNSETVAKVRQAIAILPDKQARAIAMRYLEQKDYQTIAEKLNCTEDTARSHVSKAIAALREKLAYSNISES